MIVLLNECIVQFYKIESRANKWYDWRKQKNYAKISFPLGRTKQIRKPWDIMDTNNKKNSSSISTGWESGTQARHGLWCHGTLGARGEVWSKLTPSSGWVSHPPTTITTTTTARAQLYKCKRITIYSLIDKLSYEAKIFSKKKNVNIGVSSFLLSLL